MNSVTGGGQYQHLILASIRITFQLIFMTSVTAEGQYQNHISADRHDVSDVSKGTETA